MLVACQDCKPFSSQLGDAIQATLYSNKSAFKLLLADLETGDDLKLKVSIFTTAITTKAATATILLPTVTMTIIITVTATTTSLSSATKAAAKLK